ncbi:hypothetical protein CYMTET_50897 [Cymbomonas tetramitiformis]|uniref:Uncharacterized protein n=1 Tax=Cymbomonas tetramitiformis TaxID=36881 RepID=A0AAE0BNB1_9CHLO|nr:hypothetical protein CYMTET_50897 [Cymbomonas tetramitiformis]
MIGSKTPPRQEWVGAGGQQSPRHSPDELLDADLELLQQGWRDGFKHARAHRPGLPTPFVPSPLLNQARPINRVYGGEKGSAVNYERHVEYVDLPLARTRNGLNVRATRASLPTRLVDQLDSLRRNMHTPGSQSRPGTSSTRATSSKTFGPQGSSHSCQHSAGRTYVRSSFPSASAPSSSSTAKKFVEPAASWQTWEFLWEAEMERMETQERHRRSKEQTTERVRAWFEDKGSTNDPREEEPFSTSRGASARWRWKFGPNSTSPSEDSGGSSRARQQEYRRWQQENAQEKAGVHDLPKYPKGAPPPRERPSQQQTPPRQQQVPPRSEQKPPPGNRQQHGASGTVPQSAADSLFPDFASYDIAWKKFECGLDSKTELKLLDIPWPPARCSVSGIASGDTEAQKKAKLRVSLLRWHPDKFHKIIDKTRDSDKMLVLERVKEVTQRILKEKNQC